MHKNTFNYLEETARSYYDMINQIKEIEEEILHGSNINDEVQAGRTSVRVKSDTTANKAITLTLDKRLVRLREKVKAVEKAYNAMIDDKKELLRLYYWSNKRKNLTGIAGDLNMTPRTAYRWRREFIHLIAKYMGED